MPKYTPERVEEIRSHLSDLDRRGVPISQFAREIGVASWTVRAWLRRFGKGQEVSAAKRPVADLVEVVAPVASSASIEIVVGAMTVRVPSGVDAHDLGRVLQAVRSC